MKIASAILAALIVAALGCYLLLVLKNPWGVGLVLLSLCIAFPTTIRTGVAEFTHSAADLREAGFAVVPGGRRAGDNPVVVAPQVPAEGDEEGTTSPAPESAAIRDVLKEVAERQRRVEINADLR